MNRSVALSAYTWGTPWSSRSTVTPAPRPATRSSPPRSGIDRRTAVVAPMARTTATTATVAAATRRTRRSSNRRGTPARLSQPWTKDVPCLTRRGPTATGSDGRAPQHGAPDRYRRRPRRRGRRPAVRVLRAAVATAVPRSGAGARRRGGGHRLQQPRSDPGPRIRGAGADPGRGRPDHAVVRHPVLGRSGHRAVDRRRRRVGPRRGGRRAPAAEPALDRGAAGGRRAVVDRRRGGLLGAAAGADPPTPGRDPGGGVGPERRPGGPARRHAVGAGSRRGGPRLDGAGRAGHGGAGGGRAGGPARRLRGCGRSAPAGSALVGAAVAGRGRPCGGGVRRGRPTACLGVPRRLRRSPGPR